MSKFKYRKAPDYAAFKAYMDAPFHELGADDAGREDPRHLCFLDMGVPEALVFMIWQASRRAALEDAAKVCDEKQDWYEKDRCIGQATAVGACADEIRALKDGQDANQA
jgi:hypothetical protein